MDETRDPVDAAEQALPAAANPPAAASVARAAVGPRALAAALFLAAAGCIALAMVYPFWHMRLNAPQFPSGLDMWVYLDHMRGDISTIDGLNHYIGMKPLADAARLERLVAPLAIVGVALLLVAAAFAHWRLAWLLALPAVALPLVFVADMSAWLARYGLGLDPRAALSGAVKPFVPRFLGHGVIGQFSTDAALGPGFWLATLGSLAALAGIAVAWRAGSSGRSGRSA